MKKIVLSLIVLVLIAGSSFCSSPYYAKNSIGLDSPFIGWLNPNMIDKETGGKISDLGINLGLGISYRRYFEPLKTDTFNPYFALGTFAIIIPYVGIGADYVWGNGFYLGGGLIWIIPEIHGGFMF
jgi:hypothetical protein